MCLLLMRSVAVTGSQLHVHHGISDDGQGSVGERVSALLPVHTLEQSGQIG